MHSKLCVGEKIERGQRHVFFNGMLVQNAAGGRQQANVRPMWVCDPLCRECSERGARRREPG